MLRVHLLFIEIKGSVCFSKRKGQQSEAGALTLKCLDSAGDPDGSVVTSPDVISFDATQDLVRICDAAACTFVSLSRTSPH